MSEKQYRVEGREIGSIRIYFAQGEENLGSGWKALFLRRALFRDVVDAAKAYGLLNAMMHDSPYGYLVRGEVQYSSMDPGPLLNHYVEIIDERERLEAFCKRHGELLRGRVVVYTRMERWDIEE